MRSKKSLPPPLLEQGCLPWHPPGLVAGVDEAGRGPLAGPVVAAAVILDDMKPIAGLNDSKKLTANRREVLYDEIRAKALCFCIAQASVQEIDEINILKATLLAMRRAVMGLRLKPVLVLVDGNQLPQIDVQAEAIVKGEPIPQPGIPESFRVMLKELQSLGMDVVVQDKDGNEIDMRQNFDDEETGFDMRDVAGSETVTNENELLNDYTIKDADAGFDDPSVLEDDNSGSAAPASDEVDF